jgi:hypothetical protein
VTALPFDTIFTLEARSHMLLEVMAEHFKMTDAQVFQDIQNSHRELVQVLASKGIQYKDLRNALIPTINRNENAYLFNRSNIDVANYGQAIIEHALPAFDPRSSHSVLLGDWLHNKEHNDWAIDELRKALVGATEPYTGHGHDLYIVYVNNLSDGHAEALHSRFQALPAYIGFLDLTFASVVRFYISTMLVRAFIKHRKVVIQGHEDDRSNSENISMLPYEFEKLGYSIRSLQSSLYGVFLSFKIERPIFLPDDADTKFSLLAMGASPAELDEFDVVLDERKLQYLKENHPEGLERSGFNGLSAADIAERIRCKVKSNYIYNLARSKDGSTMKFNILLENPSVARFLCALEHRPQDRQLRVITLF